MTANPQETTIPLNKLSLDPANVRKHGGGAEPIFLASISKRGLIYPLIVRAKSGIVSTNYLVVDGGKRLASYHALVKEGKAAADAPVRCIIVEMTDAQASETSLLSNVARMPMHPVDLHAAFAGHASDGWSIAEIAATYVRSDREVEQILALAKLSPKIREAWLKGQVNAEVARAYTLGADHREQERVFKKLQRRGDHAQVHAVRRELKADNNVIGALVTFVGKEAFLAAGGKMREDMFGTNHVVLTPHVAHKLADARLTRECERLVAAGWAWASPASELPQNALYSWPQVTAAKSKPTAEEAKELEQLQAVADARGSEAPAALIKLGQIEEEIEARAYGAKTKAETGCVVGVDRFGGLEVRHGVQRPTEAREKAKAPAKGEKATKTAKAKPAKPGKVSNVLMGRLSEQLTLAAAEALEKDPDVAFAVILAGFASSGDKVCVTERGFKGNAGGFRVGKTSALERAFALYSKEGREARMKALARVAGASLDFRSRTTMEPPLKSPAVAMLCDAINQVDLQAALLAKFDAKGYFDSVDKATLLAIVRDVLGAEEVRKVKDKPKAFLAKFALTNVAKKGWLPPELRTVGYAGPGAKKK